MKNITKNKAAAEVRHEIKRKMEELGNKGISHEQMWYELKLYIDGMAKRASAKKGGLGRR